MVAINICRVRLSLELRLHHEDHPQNLVLAERLAQQVKTCARRQGLGYFPALGFLIEQQQLEGELVAAYERALLATQRFVSRQLGAALRPVFSRVAVEEVSHPSLGLPRVRPQQPDAETELARFLSPGRARASVEVDSIVKGAPEGMVDASRQRVVRWLTPSYAELRVLTAEQR